MAQVADDTREIDYFGESAKALAHRVIDASAGDQARTNRDKQDWLNLLMERGGEDNQWVTWDQVSDSWRTIPTDGDFGLPAEVPRACTNVLGNKIGGISGILNQSEPAQEYRPSSDEDDDLATAQVAQDIVPALLAEVGYPHLKPILNKAVCLIDKCLVVVHYDDDTKHGEELVQAYRCTGCGKISLPADIQEAEDRCPGCGVAADPVCSICGEATSEEGSCETEGCVGQPTGGMEPAIDSIGNEIGAMYPVGKLSAELLTSFEFSLPPNASSALVEDNRYLHIHKRYSESEFLATWGDEHADLAKNASNGKAARQSQQYADGLRMLTSPHVSGFAGQVTGPLVHRIYHDPIDTEEFHFPDGLYLAMVGETIIDAGPLPVHDDRGVAIKPGVMRIFAPQIGSASGKPPADDLVPLQRARNLWETIAMLIGLRYAMPTTYIPTTVTLETPITGLPQPEVRYRSHDGQRPTTEGGRADARFCFEMMDRIDAQMDALSNLNGILQGERPSGDPTLGEIQRLEDRGFGQFKTPLDGLVRFETDLSILLMRMARETFWAPRILKIKGENDQWNVEQFTQADLSGHVDIYVNPISAWPKSQLMQQLRLQKAVELGIVQPMGDPELQSKLLSDWNLAHLKGSLDLDRKQIARELDKWKSAEMPEQIAPPMPPPVINPAMHLHYKSAWLKTEEAEQVRTDNPPLWEAMLAHIQALQVMVMPPAPPAEPGKDSSVLNAAVEAGALTPAAGKDGAKLSQLVDQGVLSPAGPAQP